MRYIIIFLLLYSFASAQSLEGQQIGGKAGLRTNSTIVNVGDNVGLSPHTGSRFSAEAQQYFARMTVQPANDTLIMIAEFIDSLKLNGSYAKLDVIVIAGINNVQNAVLDVKNLNNAVLVNAPTFTPYKGFTTDNGKYIKTGFKPSDSTNHNYRMNSAFIGVWNNSAIGGATYRYLIGCFDGTKIASIMYDNTGKTYALANGAPWGSVVPSYTTAIGLYATSRINGTDNLVALNDSINSFTRNAAAPLVPYEFYAGAVNSSGSNLYYANTQISLYMMGGGFTSQEVRNINSCVQRLKTKIGW